MGIFLFKKPSVIIDDTLYKNEVIRLKTERDSLFKEISINKSKINTYKDSIDTLNNIKNKIKYIYINKNEEIDNASLSDVVDEFKLILSESN